ncbi:Orm1 type endoplasmic reticulum protein [Dichomitus squalens]|uniref:Orm1 type endoplasmic reticulum protein n=2 Tax=Dichomitus squalens TaxID=114155 RepID=A0A4Q9Q8A6_9APHY|nr:Orm1 type endoplasmic reticulum protein [Dichomitus squalens LYAD-421 SS1]EJF62280.1 Orm1 type endoplasmic reticulum protein [Dichomitus squalens LYAD-421 SS1]TBU46372.1 Orm1 type endoplasmic reticulum protein [Dichomitus squalens]TBU63276.1 Orm1 type endoplasmic reticulum protein [Dichomitus squalens]
MAVPATTSTLSPRKSASPSLTVRVGRERSSSIVKVEKVGEESQTDVLDQGVYDNLNAEWVNRKGAWLIHTVLILAGKVVIDTIPGMPQEISWTLVNLLYLGFSYLMFHYVTGIPFHSDLHGGVYDNLTLWEQIDEGAQYTPAKKWLFIVPITLFLASTHYTHYNPWLFAINLTALVFVLIPKLPAFHRYRVRFMVPDEPSRVGTPVTPNFPRSGTATPLGESAFSIPPIDIREVDSRL